MSQSTIVRFGKNMSICRAYAESFHIKDLKKRVRVYAGMKKLPNLSKLIIFYDVNTKSSCFKVESSLVLTFNQKKKQF